MDSKTSNGHIVEALLSKAPRREDGKGRPRVDDRAILNGILWVLRTGAPWHDMPNRYPPYQTCHRRFQEWVEKGVFEEVSASSGARMSKSEVAWISGSVSSMAAL